MNAKRLVVGVGAATALLLTACTGGTPSASSSRTPTSSASAQRRAPALSARVVLPSKTIAAGSTVDAQVIVENNTGSALNISTCGSPFAVALGNHDIQPLVAWPACRQNFTIPVGKSSYTVQVSASYLGCGDGGPLPPCVDGHPPHPPPLPPGKYQAKLYQHPNVAPAPPPIAIKVTR